MPTSLKTHTPISARSPFFITCAPPTGTISAAEIIVNVQLGTRQDAAIAMTDVATFTINKSDVVNNQIVVDIAPLLRDYFEHSYLTFTGGAYQPSNTGQVYFVEVSKTITYTSGDITTEEYYTIKDGFAYFKDGVNFIPSTGATGNYPFTEPIAYDTDVTLMATDCYRQIGQDSYALIGINTGEFDRKHSDSRSWSRVKFGAGEAWKTDNTENTNVVANQFASVSDSATRLDTVNQSLLYVPLGKKNMGESWISGQDYLRVGHFVYSDDIGGTSSSVTTEFVYIEESASSNGFEPSLSSVEIYITAPYFAPTGLTILAVVGGFYDVTLPAFNDGDTDWIERTESCQIISIDGTIYEFDYFDTAFYNQMVALKAYSEPFDLPFVLKVDLPTPADEELVTIPEDSDFEWDAGTFTFSLDFWITGTPIITVGDELQMTLPAFTGCGTTWEEETDSVEVVSWDGEFISVIAVESGFSAHMECVATTIPATAYQLKLLTPISTLSDDIASINDQPTLRYEILCEPKYNVIDCIFINKFGAWDSFSFLKKSVQKFNTTSSNYKRSIGEIGVSGFSYSLTDHQKVQYNKNGYKSITVNTGFVNESFNLLLEEMMLSEKMYLIIDDVVEPVNLNTSSVEFKTSVNDKTINYTLEFDFAYDNLNNIV
jgi:hypothetical protein